MGAAKKAASEVRAGDLLLLGGEAWEVRRTGWHGNGRRSLTVDRGSTRTVVTYEAAEAVEVEVKTP
jgi:hypothetical protein